MKDAIVDVILAAFAALGIFIGVVGLIFVLGLLMAIPVYFLANILFSAAFLTFVFGTAKLSFWQAYGLSLITGLLFKSSNSTKESK